MSSTPSLPPPSLISLLCDLLPLPGGTPSQVEKYHELCLDAIFLHFGEIISGASADQSEPDPDQLRHDGYDCAKGLVTLGHHFLLELASEAIKYLRTTGQLNLFANEAVGHDPTNAPASGPRFPKPHRDPTLLDLKVSEREDSSSDEWSDDDEFLNNMSQSMEVMLRNRLIQELSFSPPTLISKHAQPNPDPTA